MTRSHKTHDVIIVGAGISGIGAAIRLLKDGFTDFVILEKAPAAGGTWRDNTYPGCECDVPSVLYSYSFAQKPDWSHDFAGQQEILDYVNETVGNFDVLPYIRFSQAVDRAQWDDTAQSWSFQTQEENYFSRTAIFCCGYLHEPIIPNIPGLAEFAREGNGTLFHSSRWNHAHNLTGERVAVIGTGASAIQFVPEIQPGVKHLAIFQRTPQWVLPKPNREICGVTKRALRQSFLLNTWRKILYSGFESLGIGFRRPALLKQLQKLGLSHLKRKVPDRELRRKLTPYYIMGCKRLLMSNAYYPALCQPNVDMHATGVLAVRGNVVVGADGSEAEVDTIILGTGFHVTEQPIAKVIYDAQGRSLSQVWEHRMEAYRGTTIAGFPNAFMVLGPNLGIGHNSAFVVIEAQLDYILSALNTMRDKQLSRVEVRAEAQQLFNADVQRNLQHTVWNTGGCSSYYLDKNGYNSIGFPWGTLRMRKMLSEFDLESYEVVKSAPSVFARVA